MSRHIVEFLVVISTSPFDDVAAKISSEVKVEGICGAALRQSIHFSSDILGTELDLFIGY